MTGRDRDCVFNLCEASNWGGGSFEEGAEGQLNQQPAGSWTDAEREREKGLSIERLLGSAVLE